jgi:hypothetical protein
MKACSKLTSATEQGSCKTSAQAKAAATMGLESVSALEFAQFTDGGADSEVAMQAKACAEAGTTFSACDFQGKFDSAASTDSSTLSSDVKATSARSNGRDAARNLIKQNLKSCSQSTNSAGSSRSVAEIISCSQGIESSTYNMLENSTRTDKSQRDAIREIAAERMKSCMSLSSASSTDCKTKALAVMQTYSTDTLTAADLTDALLVALSRVYTNVYGAIGGVGCSFADKAICFSDAANLATVYGSSSDRSAIDLGFNALRKTADTWCSCEDTSSNATECEVQAKAQYVQLGGNPAEWETTQRDQARDLATGYCNGNLTTIFRMNSTDLVFTLAAACSTLDTTAVNTAFLAYVATIDSALNGYAVSDPWEETSTTCKMKYRVELGSSTMTIDALTATLQEHTLSVGSATRRSTTTASTSTSQTTSECTDTCTIATPTSSPTTSAPTTSSPTTSTPTTSGPTTSGPTTSATTATTTVVSYKLSGLTTSQLDASTPSGQALRGAMIDAFANSTGLATSTVSITSVTAYTRRAGVTVGFTVTGVTVDVTAVNAAMTDTSSSGFGQLFVAAAAAAGQTVSLPTVESLTIVDSSSSSEVFPVWAIFLTVFMVIMIVLAILVFLWQRNRVQADMAKFKDQSRKADIENAQKTIASPGVPTTKAEVPQAPRDPEEFCDCFDAVQPPLSGATFDAVQQESIGAGANDQLSAESVSMEMEGVNEMAGSMGNSRKFVKIPVG